MLLTFAAAQGVADADEEDEGDTQLFDYTLNDDGLNDSDDNGVQCVSAS